MENITLVLNSLSSGGAEKQLLWISREIVSLGYTCTIVELVSGARSERIELMVRIVGLEGVKVLRADARSGICRSLLRVRRHILEARPVIVWSWGLRADVVCFLSLIVCPSRMWVVSIRTAVVQDGFISNKIRRFLYKRCAGAVSNTFAGIDLARIDGIQSMRCWMLPNAIASEVAALSKLPEERPAKWVIVMLGNIKILHKGYDLAVEFARKLSEKNLPFELRIAGRPDEFVELEAEIGRAGVSDLIRFYGEVSRPEAFLKEGHLYLLLSRFEGMPNTLLEALNIGLPAIATEVGDLQVLKERGAPFTLIPIANVAAAVAAVEAACANWAETRASAEKGRIWVQAHFSEASCRSVLRGILSDLLTP